MKTFIPSKFIAEQSADHFGIDGQKILTHKFTRLFPLYHHTYGKLCAY